MSAPGHDYRVGERVEVYDDDRWNPGVITHVGPVPTTGHGPMTLPSLAAGYVRVLVDAAGDSPGWTIQATVDPDTLRREGVVSAAGDTVAAERLKAEGREVTMPLWALWEIVAAAAQRGAGGQDPRWLADQAVIVAAGLAEEP